MSISISVDLIFTVRIFNIVLVNGPTSSMAPRILPVPCIHLSLCTAPRASSERGRRIGGMLRSVQPMWSMAVHRAPRHKGLHPLCDAHIRTGRHETTGREQN